MAAVVIGGGLAPSLRARYFSCRASILGRSGTSDGGTDAAPWRNEDQLDPPRHASTTPEQAPLPPPRARRCRAPLPRWAWDGLGKEKKLGAAGAPSTLKTPTHSRRVAPAPPYPAAPAPGPRQVGPGGLSEMRCLSASSGPLSPDPPNINLGARRSLEPARARTA